MNALEVSALAKKMKSVKTPMEVTSVLEKDVKLDIERILEH